MRDSVRVREQWLSVGISSRIPLVKDPSRGISKGWLCQPEDVRVRKGMFFRLLPGAMARIRAAARKEGIGYRVRIPARKPVILRKGLRAFLLRPSCDLSGAG